MDVIAQIVTTANQYGVDPRIAIEVGMQESGLNPDVRDGSAGEIGIFQLKPSTAAGLGIANPRDPVQNIQGGVMYLAQLLGMFGGDPQKAIAAYNAGPGTVRNAVSNYSADWFSHIPGSTQNYVTSVLGAANEYTSEPGGPQLTEAVAGISLATVAWVIGAAVLTVLAFQASEA